MMMQSAKSVGRATSPAASSTTERASRGPAVPPRRRATCSIMITAPSTMMPKSTAPSDSKLAERPRRWREERAEQRERDDERDDERGPQAHEEDAHHQHDEDRAHDEVVRHRDQCAVHEPPAVVES